MRRKKSTTEFTPRTRFALQDSAFLLDGRFPGSSPYLPLIRREVETIGRLD